MSTILKTLKKLEEEKSVLEKKVDLKELVLQDEESFDIDSFFSRKNILKGALVFAGVGIAIAWLWKGKPEDRQIVQAPRPQPVFLQETPPVKKQDSNSVPGIPLSNIPEQKKQELYPEAVSEEEYYALEKEKPQVPEKVVERIKKPVPQVSRPALEEQDIYEIQSLIASAKSLADEPDEIQVSKLRSHGSIPGLKVKGIIFFSPESSSNHIFVSTPRTNNQKMKIGDSIHSATLMKIESTGAVFAYKGESVFMAIGQSGG
ncbi:MAG: hypothetical protein VW455_02680 [Nitrospinota bacterium]